MTRVKKIISNLEPFYEFINDIIITSQCLYVTAYYANNENLGNSIIMSACVESAEFQ